MTELHIPCSQLSMAVSDDLEDQQYWLEAYRNVQDLSYTPIIQNIKHSTQWDNTNILFLKNSIMNIQWNI